MAIDKAKLNDLSHYGASLTNLVQTVDLLLNVPDDQQAEDCIKVIQEILEQCRAIVEDIIAEL